VSDIDQTRLATESGWLSSSGSIDHGRFEPGAAERWIVTPRFHHWHHSAQPEALDKNFAVHLPWIDKLFGTYHLPKDQWPTRYGLSGDRIPDSYTSHLVWPFRRAK